MFSHFYITQNQISMSKMYIEVA